MVSATSRGLRNVLSARSLRSRPKTPPGMEAMARNPSRLPSSEANGFPWVLRLVNAPPIILIQSPIRAPATATSVPEMKSHIEGQRVLLVAEEPRHRDEMPRAGDGQELARALNDPENDRFEKIHGVGRLRFMGFAVSIDGRVGSPEEVTLKVTDNGFVFGDSAYETLRTYGGRPFELDRHLLRLRRSIGLLGFDLMTSDDEIKARIDACLSFASNAESYLRVIVSRGVGDMSYRFERIPAPTMAMYVKPLEPQNDSLYEMGAAAVIVSLRRNPVEALNPAIKSSNLLNNALATREAYAKGAFEGDSPQHPRRGRRGGGVERVHREERASCSRRPYRVDYWPGSRVRSRSRSPRPRGCRMRSGCSMPRTSAPPMSCSSPVRSRSWRRW